MSRLRCRTRSMSIAVEPVTIPNLAAWRTRSATFALQISLLLGRQLMFGQEPPIHFRSTTAVRCPDLAKCQARYLPPRRCPGPGLHAVGAETCFSPDATGVGILTRNG